MLNVCSTQPWPYPANLMIGAISQTIPESETIDLGNDPELEGKFASTWLDVAKLSRLHFETRYQDLGRLWSAVVLSTNDLL